MKHLILTILSFLTLSAAAQEVAILKYQGGGDWYGNPTALPNLIHFCNQTIQTRIKATPQTVTPDNLDIYQFPLLHMTGHGNVFFSEEDIANLKAYLLSGGFLHIDDNYGMEPYVRKELKKLFPDKRVAGNFCKS